VVAVFTKDVAETKATRATDAAAPKFYPLLFHHRTVGLSRSKTSSPHSFCCSRHPAIAGNNSGFEMAAGTRASEPFVSQHYQSGVVPDQKALPIVLHAVPCDPQWGASDPSGDAAVSFRARQRSKPFAARTDICWPL